MHDEEVRARSQAAASFWRSWDCNPDTLTGWDRVRIAQLLGVQGGFRHVPYAELRAAADLLAEQYENHPLTTVT
jgi:predicted ATPase